MQGQDKKFLRWILGGGLILIFLLIPGLLIARYIADGNTELFERYASYMLIIVLLAYLILSAITIAKYNKHFQNYEREKLEKASKELTSEFKPVLLNKSEHISPELFKCQAKVDEQGKIVCEIKLEHKVKFENYEELLRFFHFSKE